jgi:hypothetical protein
LNRISSSDFPQSAQLQPQVAATDKRCRPRACCNGHRQGTRRKTRV